MGIAEYKYKWFLAKREILKGRGLRDVDIARQMKISAPYLSEILSAQKIGDSVIERMCKSFGFKFPDAPEVTPNANPVPEGMILVPKDMWDALVLQGSTNMRLLNSVLGHLEKLTAK